MTFRGFGVVAGSDFTTAVREAGADYVEPTIADNVVLPSADGQWHLNGAYDGERFPSFAILFPQHLSLFESDTSVVDEYLDATLTAVGAVAEPGAKVVFGSGTARTVPDGLAWDAALLRFADVVRSTRDIAAEHSLRIVLEPLNRSETNLLHSVAETHAFLDDHGIDDVDIVADLFHIQTEAEPFDVIREHVGRIGHVHVADAGRRPIGTGDWPWLDFLRTLHDGGYRDTVSIECGWGSDPVPEIRAALDLLRDAQSRF